MPVESSSASPKKKSASPKYKAPTFEEEALEDYIVPDLTMRRGIWENFPVVTEEIEPAGGFKRYAIMWHRKNLKEWRESRSASWDEYMEYEAFAEFRLFHTLRKFEHIYRLEKPRNDSELVILVALKEPVSPPRTAGAAAAAAPRRAAYRGPALGPKLADIAKYFPGVAVWSKVEGRRGESTWGIEIRGDFLRRAAPAERERALEELDAALRASKYWDVIRPVGHEFARLEMRHD